VAEGRTVVHRKAGFSLPLVHHLVQQGMLDLGPRVPGDMAAADRDFQRPAGVKVNAQLTEPAAHSTREPDREAPEYSAEVLAVEPLVSLAEAVEQQQVAWSRPLRPGDEA
jgi:hypothetical protein